MKSITNINQLVPEDVGTVVEVLAGKGDVYQGKFSRYVWERLIYQSTSPHWKDSSPQLNGIGRNELGVYFHSAYSNPDGSLPRVSCDRGYQDYTIKGLDFRMLDGVEHERPVREGEIASRRVG